MDQYLNLCRRIVDDGRWVDNPRTGVRCLTCINATMTFDASTGQLPVVTTRKAPWKLAIAELLGYLRGYSSAADFRALGAPTWDANANENEQWLANPARKGTDDMGRVYGVQGRGWRRPDGVEIDQLRKIVGNLSRGKDDRGEILTFYNPGEFHLGCLRPCLHTHQFSLLGDELYLTSIQRSCDVPLGGVANAVQVVALLRLMAQITGTRPAAAHWTIINAHIYENQLQPMVEQQLRREPFPAPTLEINPDIKSLEDLDTWVTVDDFKLHNYRHHPSIRYPFSV